MAPQDGLAPALPTHRGGSAPTQGQAAAQGGEGAAPEPGWATSPNPVGYLGVVLGAMQLWPGPGSEHELQCSRQPLLVTQHQKKSEIEPRKPLWGLTFEFLSFPFSSVPGEGVHCVRHVKGRGPALREDKLASTSKGRVLKFSAISKGHYTRLLKAVARRSCLHC